MGDPEMSSGIGGNDGDRQVVLAPIKGHKKKKNKRNRTSSSSEVVCTWQCVAMSLIMLCVPTILALRAMHSHTDSLVRSHQTQTMFYNSTAPSGVVGSALWRDWHQISVADLICYSKRYADTRELHGFDPTALLRHYVEVGQKEGRDPFCALTAEDQQPLSSSSFGAGRIAAGAPVMLVDIPCAETSGKDPSTCRIRCTDSACSNAQSLCEMLHRCQSVSLSGNRGYALLKGPATEEKLHTHGDHPPNLDLDLSTYDYIRQARRGYKEGNDVYDWQKDERTIKRKNSRGGKLSAPELQKKWRQHDRKKQPKGDTVVDAGDLPFDPMGPLRAMDFQKVAKLGSDGSTPTWNADLDVSLESISKVATAHVFPRTPGRLEGFGELPGVSATIAASTVPAALNASPTSESWGLPANGAQLEEEMRARRSVKYPRSQLSARAKLRPLGGTPSQRELNAIARTLGMTPPPPRLPELRPSQPQPPLTQGLHSSPALPPQLPPPRLPQQQPQMQQLQPRTGVRVLPVTNPRSRSKCATSPLVGKQDSCLPAFLIIGAQKSGTSTLAHLMGQHPQIRNPRVKELLFFNWNNDFKIKCRPKAAELRSYFGDFPRITQSQHLSTGAVSGEWSATYLPCHCCANAVFQAMPKVKIVAILRHPIDRAHSRFVEQIHFAKKYKKREINNCPVWMGWEKFADHAIDKLQKCFRSIPGKDASTDRECIHHNNEVGWSIYAPSIIDWLDKFGQSNFRVTYTEDLKTDPLAVMRSIESHINLEPYRHYQNLNSTMNARGAYGWKRKSDEPDHSESSSKMEATTYMKLHDFYRPSVVKLHRLAQEGIITPIPFSWKRQWELS